jgi:hypothetical protein
MQKLACHAANRLKYERACGILAAGEIELLLVAGQADARNYTGNLGDGKASGANR